MCGIAGYIGKKPPSRGHFEKASYILKHRGPDGVGYYSHYFKNFGVSLMHRRLAIIDLDSRSNQPFRYQKTVLIFNGEIYNYLEIRKQLESLGHLFQTTGDTEVLIHALCQWREDALDKLEGMWAFAWYDENDGSLILSRDRFGEKPLYIWIKDDGLYFASEIKGLAAMSGEWPKVNELHLLRFLNNGYRSLYKTKETFFHEIKEVPPRTFITVNSKGINDPRSYWEPQLGEDMSISFDDAVAMTREALTDMVRIRMRSDVPIAFCMSGGIDSNSLISLATKELSYDVHGFTIVNTDVRYEEQALVDKAVKELGIKHNSVTLSKENFLPNMQQLVIAHDAPISTISYYVHWLLTEQIQKSGYKISISGTGADEIFSGYYDHHSLFLASIYENKSLYNKSKKSWLKHVAPLIQNKHLKDPDKFIKNPNFRDHIYSGQEFEDRLFYNFFEPFREKQYPVNLLRKRMLNELFEEVVPVILHEDDANSMYHSIENRSPFLDRNLFETSLKFQTKHLIRNGKTKSILREAMRGIVPNIILDSYRKVGFNAPVENLLDIRNSNIREQILDQSSIYKIVKKEAIEKMMKFKTMPNSESKFLFSFLGAKIFLENYRI